MQAAGLGRLPSDRTRRGMYDRGTMPRKPDRRKPQSAYSRGINEFFEILGGLTDVPPDMRESRQKRDERRKKRR